MPFTDYELTAKQLRSLNDDVVYLICLAAARAGRSVTHETQDDVKPSPILLSLCSTCKRVREIGAPLIFRKATLTDCKTNLVRLPSIDPWLTCMERSKSFQRHMKFLNVELFSILEQDASRLATILKHTTNLRSLKLVTPQARETTQERFIPVLKTCNLPKLEALVLSAGLEALVPRFDNITSLEVRGEDRYASVSTEAVEQYATEDNLPRLQHLNLFGPIQWSPAFLVALSTNLPQLQGLGTLRGGKPGYSFEALLRIPDLFPQLRELTIAPLNELGLRHFAPNCGTARVSCRLPDRICKDHVRSALWYAVRICFNIFRSLRILHCEEERVSCVRREDGSVAEVVIEERPIGLHSLGDEI